MDDIFYMEMSSIWECTKYGHFGSDNFEDIAK